MRSTAIRSAFTTVSGRVYTGRRKTGHRPDATAEVDGLVRRGKVNRLGLFLDGSGCRETRTNRYWNALAVTRRVLRTRCTAEKIKKLKFCSRKNLKYFLVNFLRETLYYQFIVFNVF